MMRLLSKAVLTIPLACLAFGQSTPPPAFEVADLRLSKSTSGQLSQAFLPGGRVELLNATMRQLIMGAFNLGPSLLFGGPDWLDKDRYDLVAKAASDLPIETKRLMLQALLVERCKLVTHREDRPIAVYALVASSRGTKLQPVPEAGQFTCDTAPAAEGLTHRICRHITLDDLGHVLPRLSPRNIDLPVVNLTELKGTFDVDLEWDPQSSQPKPGAATDAPPVPDQPSRTIFDALEKLGLRLELRKHPMPSVVIDSVERVPAGN